MKKTIILSVITFLCICSYAQEEKNIYKECISYEINSNTGLDIITYHIDLKKEFLSESKQSEIYRKLVNSFKKSEFDIVENESQFTINIDIANKDRKHDAYLILRNYNLTKNK